MAVLLNDLYGGVINLGLICHPNSHAKVENLVLFADSLICYGSGYMEIKNPYKWQSLREMRMNGIRDLSVVAA